MRLIKDIYVTLFGAGTSLATAWFLVYIETRYEIAIYTYSYWFALPLGAIAAGIVGGIGYYFGAKLVGHRPGPTLLPSVLLVSGATFFAIHYLIYDRLRTTGGLNYYLMERLGFSLRELPFFDYLDLSIRGTTLMFFGRGGTTQIGPLGAWGYAVATLQVIGFAAGGLSIYLYLRKLPYCFICSRYLRSQAKWTRYYRDSSELAIAAQVQNYHFERGELEEAIKAIVESGHSEQKSREAEGILQLWQCRSCGFHRLNFTARQKVNHHWQEIPELKLTCVESNDKTTLEAEFIAYSK